MVKDNLKLGFKKRFSMFIEGATKGTDTDIIYQCKMNIATTLGMCIGIGMAMLVLGYRTFIVNASKLDWYQVGWVIFLIAMTVYQIQALITSIKMYYKMKPMFSKPTEQDGAVTEEAAIEIINRMKSNLIDEAKVEKNESK